MKHYFLLLILFAFVAPGFCAQDPLILGAESEAGDCWFAKVFECPEGQALSGVRWYNNDQNSVFPGIYVATTLGDIEESVLVAENVTGNSLTMSEVNFTNSVSVEGDIYIIFKFPEDSGLEFNGTGGGAGIGVLKDGSSAGSWMSGDYYVWCSLSEGVNFEITPIISEIGEDTLIMGRAGAAVLPNIFSASCYPNPFNPVVRIDYNLPEAEHVEIEIFDIQGSCVINLKDEIMPRGNHSVLWNGMSAKGNRVSSGQYLVKVSAGNESLVNKVTLLK
jgi:hypothetical protein